MDIPRGIEVLIKKAAVDAEFKAVLLQRRAAAADEIGLVLEPAEKAMLAAMPQEQLEAVIARTQVSPEHRRVFLGKTAAAMLAVVGGAIVLYGMTATAGVRARKKIRPDGGVRPDRPVESTGGLCQEAWKRRPTHMM
jgi:hypothetical protein